MSRAWVRGLLFSLGLIFSLLIPFQNCAPAKLSGTEISSDGSLTEVAPNTVGSKVDLASLLGAATESASTVLYPSANRQASYASGSPILENILLNHSSFSRIEWIHGPTATVIAMGPKLSGLQYSSNLSGTIYLFGYRQSTSYFITKLELMNTGTSNLGVGSAGAFTISQNVVSSDATSETILIQTEAPAVQLKSIQYYLASSNLTVDGQRAISINKKLSESQVVEIRLTDLLGQSITRTINLPAKVISPVTTTTTLPIPPPPTTTTTTLPPTQGALNMAAATFEQGFSYIVPQNFGTPEDSNAFPFQSKLQIFENGVALGVAHAVHADIRNIGKGRFSHWAGAVRFSASDNTDPRTNGRTYTYQVLPVAPPMLSCGSAIEFTNAVMSCPTGLVVKSIRFAAYGDVSGTCGNYKVGTCSSANALNEVKARCPVGATSCTIHSDNSIFLDPCYGFTKTLAFEALCGAP